MTFYNPHLKKGEQKQKGKPTIQVKQGNGEQIPSSPIPTNCVTQINTVKKHYQSNLNNYIFLKRGKGERKLKAIPYKSLREPYLQKEKGKIPFLKRGCPKVV